MHVRKRLNLLISLLILGFHWPAQASILEGVSLHYHRFERLNDPLFQSKIQDWFGISIDQRWELAHQKGLRVKADTRYYARDGYFNYSVPEAYWHYLDKRNELTLGRRIMDWNPGEAYWGLNNGLNSRQGFTLLGQEREGLTGLHFQRQMGDLSFKFFMSYLFIPNLNPDMAVSNGEIKSHSEWVRQPPKRTTYRGVLLDIHYKANIPEVSDVVFKKSLGAALDFKWSSGHVLAFAIYKPENRLRANALVEGVDTTKGVVHVMAEPIVNHHAMVGAHIVQRVGKFGLMAAIDVTDPNATLGKDFDVLDPVELNESNRVFDSDDFVIRPSYDRESYFRLSANTKLLDAQLGLAFIKLLSKNTRGDDFYTDTVKWKNALGFFIQAPLTENLGALFDYKFDISRRDQIIKAELNYNWRQQLSFMLGLELLKSPLRESYWSVYRANDAAYLRLTYHF